MDYKKIYDQLIESRRDNRPAGYTERHHIIPRSLGGSEDKDNKVRLTGREHWVAHLLLHRIHDCQATAHACHKMTRNCKKRGIPNVKNSRMFQYVREEQAKYASILGKQRTGKKNGSYGTMWICNVDLQENKKIKKTDEIPDGWIKGRNKWKKKHFVARTKLPKRIKITNGKIVRVLYWEDQLPIPTGWCRGVIPNMIDPEVELLRRKKISLALKKRNYRWITNGLINKNLFTDVPCPMPDGFRYGMTSKSRRI